MTSLFLYASQHSELTDYIIWTVLLLILLIFVVFIFWQRKAGRELSYELKLLEKVKKSNIEYEFVLKAMKLSTWHIDPETMNVTYDNDFREKGDLWRPEEDGSGLKASATLLYEQDGERVFEALKKICEGLTEEYHEIYRVMIPNSNKFYWEESYATIAERNVEGKPLKIVGTSMRIDDRKDMENALVEARYKAEESDRLKTAFLANMSHEIRTPLNAIVGFTSVLPDVTEAEERQTLLDLIHENTQKLLRIVDDVVSISKVEAGKEELMISTFDLSITLREIIDQFTPKLKPGVEMKTNFQDQSLMVVTDKNRVQEIVRHLLSNAVKFTDHGHVEVGFEQHGSEHVRLWVEDTGKGISPDNQERVFERFFKVDEFVPGAGLGLSTCRTMAYSLGGSVTVQSELDEGSTFTFEFPQQKVAM